MGIVIHPTALVSDDVTIGEGTTVGPYAIIEPGARIGPDNEIAAGCYIFGGVDLGARNRLMRAASLGGEPQSMSYAGEPTRLVVGDDNWFGENTVVHRGTAGTGVTIIGNHLYMMNGSHIGHDTRIGDYVIMAPDVKVGGFAEVGERANLGAGAGIHQQARVGQLVMVAAMARVTRDVVPFTTVADEGDLVGLNTIGIRRAEACPNQHGSLKAMYRKFSVQHTPLEEFRAWLQGEPPEYYRDAWLAFLSSESKRGYARGRGHERRNHRSDEGGSAGPASPNSPGRATASLPRAAKGASRG